MYHKSVPFQLRSLLQFFWSQMTDLRDRKWTENWSVCIMNESFEQFLLTGSTDLL